MRKNTHLYSFEKPKKNLKSRLARISEWFKGFVKDDDSLLTDARIFYKRVGITSYDELSSKEKYTIDGFLKNCLYNINWYSKRIRKEQRWLKWYYAITIIVLIAAPLFIFFFTSKVGSGILSIKEDLLDRENTVAVITVVLTLILTLHQFISSWIDQRKVVVEFSKASVQLKNLYYSLENKFYGGATEGYIDYAGRLDQQVVSDEFLRSLSDSIVLSRRIVDEETQNYYQLRAQPTFNIASILQDSSGSAKQLFGLFKSNKFNPEEIRSNLKTSEEKVNQLQEQITHKKEELARLLIKLKSGRDAAEKLAQKLEEIDMKNPKNLSDSERNLRFKYESEFDALDMANDELDQEYGLIELEIKLLENRMIEIKK